jgi:hypothetical protein
LLQPGRCGLAPADSLLLRRLRRAGTGCQLQCHNCRLVGLPRVHHRSACAASGSGSHSNRQATAAARDAAVINASVRDLLLLLQLLLLLSSSQGARLLPFQASSLAWGNRVICRLLLL